METTNTEDNSSLSSSSAINTRAIQSAATAAAAVVTPDRNENEKRSFLGMAVQPSPILPAKKPRSASMPKNSSSSAISDSSLDSWDSASNGGSSMGNFRRQSTGASSIRSEASQNYWTPTPDKTADYTDSDESAVELEEEAIKRDKTAIKASIRRGGGGAVNRTLFAGDDLTRVTEAASFEEEQSRMDSSLDVGNTLDTSLNSQSGRGGRTAATNNNNSLLGLASTTEEKEGEPSASPDAAIATMNAHDRDENDEQGSTGELSHRPLSEEEEANLWAHAITGTASLNDEPSVLIDDDPQIILMDNMDGQEQSICDADSVIATDTLEEMEATFSAGLQYKVLASQEDQVFYENVIADDGTSLWQETSLREEDDELGKSDPGTHASWRSVEVQLKTPDGKRIPVQMKTGDAIHYMQEKVAKETGMPLPRRSTIIRRRWSDADLYGSDVAEQQSSRSSVPSRQLYEDGTNSLMGTRTAPEATTNQTSSSYTTYEIHCRMQKRQQAARTPPPTKSKNPRCISPASSLGSSRAPYQVSDVFERLHYNEKREEPVWKEPNAQVIQARRVTGESSVANETLPEIFDRLHHNEKRQESVWNEPEADIIRANRSSTESVNTEPVPEIHNRLHHNEKRPESLWQAPEPDIVQPAKFSAEPAADATVPEVFDRLHHNEKREELLWEKPENDTPQVARSTAPQEEVPEIYERLHKNEKRDGSLWQEPGAYTITKHGSNLHPVEQKRNQGDRDFGGAEKQPHPLEATDGGNEDHSAAALKKTLQPSGDEAQGNSAVQVVAGGAMVQTLEAQAKRDQALREKLATQGSIVQSQNSAGGSSALAAMASAWTTKSTKSKAKADSAEARETASPEEKAAKGGSAAMGLAAMAATHKMRLSSTGAGGAFKGLRTAESASSSSLPALKTSAKTHTTSPTPGPTPSPTPGPTPGPSSSPPGATPAAPADPTPRPSPVPRTNPTPEPTDAASGIVSESSVEESRKTASAFHSSLKPEGPTEEQAVSAEPSVGAPLNEVESVICTTSEEGEPRMVANDLAEGQSALVELRRSADEVKDTASHDTSALGLIGGVENPESKARQLNQETRQEDGTDDHTPPKDGIAGPQPVDESEILVSPEAPVDSDTPLKDAASMGGMNGASSMEGAGALKEVTSDDADTTLEPLELDMPEKTQADHAEVQQSAAPVPQGVADVADQSDVFCTPAVSLDRDEDGRNGDFATDDECNGIEQIEDAVAAKEPIVEGGSETVPSEPSAPNEEGLDSLEQRQQRSNQPQGSKQSDSFVTSAPSLDTDDCTEEAGAVEGIKGTEQIHGASIVQGEAGSMDPLDQDTPKKDGCDTLKPQEQGTSGPQGVSQPEIFLTPAASMEIDATSQEAVAAESLNDLAASQDSGVTKEPANVACAELEPLAQDTPEVDNADSAQPQKESDTEGKQADQSDVFVTPAASVEDVASNHAVETMKSIAPMHGVGSPQGLGEETSKHMEVTEQDSPAPLAQSAHLQQTDSTGPQGVNPSGISVTQAALGDNDLQTEDNEIVEGSNGVAVSQEASCFQKAGNELNNEMEQLEQDKEEAIEAEPSQSQQQNGTGPQAEAHSMPSVAPATPENQDAATQGTMHGVESNAGGAGQHSVVVQELVEEAGSEMEHLRHNTLDSASANHAQQQEDSTSRQVSSTQDDESNNRDMPKQAPLAELTEEKDAGTSVSPVEDAGSGAGDSVEDKEQAENLLPVQAAATAPVAPTGRPEGQGVMPPLAGRASTEEPTVIGKESELEVRHRAPRTGTDQAPEESTEEQAVSAEPSVMNAPMIEDEAPLSTTGKDSESQMVGKDLAEAVDKEEDSTSHDAPVVASDGSLEKLDSPAAPVDNDVPVGGSSSIAPIMQASSVQQPVNEDGSELEAPEQDAPVEEHADHAQPQQTVNDESQGEANLSNGPVPFIESEHRDEPSQDAPADAEDSIGGSEEVASEVQETNQDAPEVVRVVQPEQKDSAGPQGMVPSESSVHSDENLDRERASQDSAVAEVFNAVAPGPEEVQKPSGDSGSNSEEMEQGFQEMESSADVQREQDVAAGLTGVDGSDLFALQADTFDGDAPSQDAAAGRKVTLSQNAGPTQGLCEEVGTNPEGLEQDTPQVECAEDAESDEQEFAGPQGVLHPESSVYSAPDDFKGVLPGLDAGVVPEPTEEPVRNGKTMEEDIPEVESWEDAQLQQEEGSGHQVVAHLEAVDAPFQDTGTVEDFNGDSSNQDNGASQELEECGANTENVEHSTVEVENLDDAQTALEDCAGPQEEKDVASADNVDVDSPSQAAAGVAELNAVTSSQDAAADQEPMKEAGSSVEAKEEDSSEVETTHDTQLEEEVGAEAQGIDKADNFVASAVSVDIDSSIHQPCQDDATDTVVNGVLQSQDTCAVQEHIEEPDTNVEAAQHDAPEVENPHDAQQKKEEFTGQQGVDDEENLVALADSVDGDAPRKDAATVADFDGVAPSQDAGAVKELTDATVPNVETKEKDAPEVESTDDTKVVQDVSVEAQGVDEAENTVASPDAAITNAPTHQPSQCGTNEEAFHGVAIGQDSYVVEKHVEVSGSQTLGQDGPKVDSSDEACPEQEDFRGLQEVDKEENLVESNGTVEGHVPSKDATTVADLDGVAPSEDAAVVREIMGNEGINDAESKEKDNSGMESTVKTQQEHVVDAEFQGVDESENFVASSDAVDVDAPNHQPCQDPHTVAELNLLPVTEPSLVVQKQVEVSGTGEPNGQEVGTSGEVLAEQAAFAVPQGVDDKEKVAAQADTFDGNAPREDAAAVVILSSLARSQDAGADKQEALAEMGTNVEATMKDASEAGSKDDTQPDQEVGGEPQQVDEAENFVASPDAVIVDAPIHQASQDVAAVKVLNVAASSENSFSVQEQINEPETVSESLEEDGPKVDSSDEVQREESDSAGLRGVDEAEKVVASVDSHDEKQAPSQCAAVGVAVLNAVARSQDAGAAQEQVQKPCTSKMETKEKDAAGVESVDNTRTEREAQAESQGVDEAANFVVSADTVSGDTRNHLDSPDPIHGGEINLVASSQDDGDALADGPGTKREAIEQENPQELITEEAQLDGSVECEMEESKAGSVVVGGAMVQSLKAQAMRDQALREELAKGGAIEQSKNSGGGSSALAAMASAWTTTSSKSKAEATEARDTTTTTKEKAAKGGSAAMGLAALAASHKIRASKAELVPESPLAASAKVDTVSNAAGSEVETPVGTESVAEEQHGATGAGTDQAPGSHAELEESTEEAVPVEPSVMNAPMIEDEAPLSTTGKDGESQMVGKDSAKEQLVLAEPTSAGDKEEDSTSHDEPMVASDGTLEKLDSPSAPVDNDVPVGGSSSIAPTMQASSVQQPVDEDGSELEAPAQDAPVEEHADHAQPQQTVNDESQGEANLSNGPVPFIESEHRDEPSQDAAADAEDSIGGSEEVASEVQEVIQGTPEVVRVVQPEQKDSAGPQGMVPSESSVHSDENLDRERASQDSAVAEVFNAVAPGPEEVQKPSEDSGTNPEEVELVTPDVELEVADEVQVQHEGCAVVQCVTDVEEQVQSIPLAEEVTNGAPEKLESEETVLPEDENLPSSSSAAYATAVASVGVAATLLGPQIDGSAALHGGSVEAWNGQKTVDISDGKDASSKEARLESVDDAKALPGPNAASPMASVVASCEAGETAQPKSIPSEKMATGAVSVAAMAAVWTAGNNSKSDFSDKSSFAAHTIGKIKSEGKDSGVAFAQLPDGDHKSDGAVSGSYSHPKYETPAAYKKPATHDPLTANTATTEASTVASLTPPGSADWRLKPSNLSNQFQPSPVAFHRGSFGSPNSRPSFGSPQAATPVAHGDSLHTVTGTGVEDTTESSDMTSGQNEFQMVTLRKRSSNVEKHITETKLEFAEMVANALKKRDPNRSSTLEALRHIGDLKQEVALLEEQDDATVSAINKLRAELLETFNKGGPIQEEYLLRWLMPLHRERDPQTGGLIMSADQVALLQSFSTSEELGMVAGLGMVRSILQTNFKAINGAQCLEDIHKYAHYRIGKKGKRAPQNPMELMAEVFESAQDDESAEDLHQRVCNALVKWVVREVLGSTKDKVNSKSCFHAIFLVASLKLELQRLAPAALEQGRTVELLENSRSELMEVAAPPHSPRPPIVQKLLEMKAYTDDSPEEYQAQASTDNAPSPSHGPDSDAIEDSTLEKETSMREAMALRDSSKREMNISKKSLQDRVPESKLPEQVQDGYRVIRCILGANRPHINVSDCFEAIRLYASLIVAWNEATDAQAQLTAADGLSILSSPTFEEDRLQTLGQVMINKEKPSPPAQINIQSPDAIGELAMEDATEEKEEQDRLEQKRLERERKKEKRRKKKQQRAEAARGEAAGQGESEEGQQIQPAQLDIAALMQENPDPPSASLPHPPGEPGSFPASAPTKQERQKSVQAKVQRTAEASEVQTKTRKRLFGKLKRIRFTNKNKSDKRNPWSKLLG